MLNQGLSILFGYINAKQSLFFLKKLPWFPLSFKLISSIIVFLKMVFVSQQMLLIRNYLNLFSHIVHNLIFTGTKKVFSKFVHPKFVKNAKYKIFCYRFHANISHKVNVCKIKKTLCSEQ